MTTKKFEITLTPQNDEWIKLVPNAPQNMDNVINKLLSASINAGLFLEIISQSLTLSDLAKFKSSYSRLQQKRAGHMADLECVTPTPVDRRKHSSPQPTILDDEDDNTREEVSVHSSRPPTSSTKKDVKKDTKKQFGHGFTEDSF